MTALSLTCSLHPELQPALRVLVVNPFARGVDRAAVARVVELLHLDARAVRVVGRDGSATALAAEAVRDRVDRVVAAGGDGTLHDVVQQLAGTDTALGLIPLGTSNDLAARLRIPCDLGTACAIALSGAVDAVDLLAMDGRLVATVGGFGLPARVARACNELRERPATQLLVRPLGRGIYAAVAGAETLAGGVRLVACTVRANGGAPTTLRAAAILVGLVERFGGGIHLVDTGRLVPGTFAALIVTPRHRADLLGILLRLRLGLAPARGARLLTGLRRLEVRTAGPVGAFGDGEWIGAVRRSTVTIEPYALRVVVPRERLWAGARRLALVEGG